MRWYFAILIFALALAAVASLPLLRRSRSIKAAGVTARPLLSRPEQIFYRRLVRAFPGHVILAQVALSQLLVVDRTGRSDGAQSIANRFRQLVADFVICAPDFTALAVIELDDRSHNRASQRERDQRKDQFLQAAGIKVVRVVVSNIPNETDLKALVGVVSGARSPQLARRA
jgi:hypothetical protein